MQPISLTQHSHSGVFTDGRDLYTLDLGSEEPAPGRAVEGDDGRIYRPFPPSRTKLASIVKRGSRSWPFGPESRVLYLGAGAGTTVAFMSDICPQGQIVAVEFAPEPFRKLVEVARGRPNVVPILADARRPDTYSAQVGPPVDLIYQDVAQRDQWAIASRNAATLLREGGWVVLVIKAKSIDVAREAGEVFREVRAAAQEAGYAVEELLDLEPFDLDHAVLFARRR